MKLFGRDPAFWVGVVEAVLALFLAWNALDLTDERVALIMAAVVAALGVYTAYVTKDTMLGYGIGLAKAVLALGAGYGLNLAVDQTASLIALATILLGAYQRTQTAPLVEPSFTNPPSAPVLTAAA